MKRFLSTIAIVAITGSLLAQDIQVNRQNKTIAVTAEESTTADAEIAVLDIGYHNYGITQDAAFQENVRVAERIMKALLDAQVPKPNHNYKLFHLNPLYILRYLHIPPQFFPHLVAQL